ncbi:MAG: N-acyl homoserine lactonase family protein, partial [Oligoflexales bacterium]|nr:N-acyl homoserine lactonase family protein [Oligoflexales bacterium]
THKYYDTEGFVELPVSVFLIEGNGRKILVDTGMSNTEIAGKYHHPGSYQPEGYAIHEQLEGLGIRCEEIDMIIFTHLHWDHVYYLDRFPNAELVANKREYDFAVAPIPLYYKSYEFPALGLTPQFAGRTFTLVEGETEIIPGISVYPSTGHSIGHQTVVVSTKDGQYHLCGDLIFTFDNLKEIPEIHYTITPPARFLNIDESWRSIEELKRRAKGTKFILPTHAPEMIDLAKNKVILGK